MQAQKRERKVLDGTITVCSMREAEGACIEKAVSQVRPITPETDTSRNNAVREGTRRVNRPA
jgi:hypothetical protein